MWIEDFSDTLSKYFDSPKVFLEALAYWTAGAALGDRIYVPVLDGVYPNIYMILAAPPGWYRKSTACRQAVRIASSVIGDDHILPNDASTEPFVKEANQLEYAMLVYDEFASFLDQTEKDYARGIRSAVMSLYEPNGQIHKIARSGKDIINLVSNCRLSFISSCTTNWLEESMKKSFVTSGLLSRFIVVEARKKEKSIPIPPKIEKSEIIRLSNELTQIISSVSGEIKLDDQAIKSYEGCYEEIEKFVTYSANSDTASLVSRCPSYIFKFAMIRAAVSGRNIINEEDILEIAENIIKPSISASRRLVQIGSFEDSFVRSCEKILEYIGNYEEISAKKLSQNLHIKKRDLLEMLDHLEFQGRVFSRKQGKSHIISIQSKLENE